MIDNYLTFFDNEEENGERNLSTIMSILYSEACSLGHGKGYTFFSNPGAFMEDYNIISLTDFMLCGFLKLYNLNLIINDEKKKYEKLENAIEKTVNELEFIRRRKIELLKLKKNNR